MKEDKEVPIEVVLTNLLYVLKEVQIAQTQLSKMNRMLLGLDNFIEKIDKYVNRKP